MQQLSGIGYRRKEMRVTNKWVQVFLLLGFSFIWFVFAVLRIEPRSSRMPYKCTDVHS
jgi:hypothetical protein